MPNTGKSTFFNRLTGARARVGNWPGITVDLMTAKTILGADSTHVIDLPGIYSFHGFSEDEKVVRDFLENNVVDLVVVILNATQIDRQLPLALQIRKLGLPAVIVLNMSDESRQLGMRIDTTKLAEALGYPVAMVSAKYGMGFNEARQTIGLALQAPHPDAELGLERVFSEDHEIESDTARILNAAVDLPRQMPKGQTARLDRWLLHPWLGLPIFFLLMFLLFQFIFTLGKPLQDGVAWVLTEIRDRGLEPWMADWPPLLSG
jgi:ferrous iron transport protein B